MATPNSLYRNVAVNQLISAMLEMGDPDATLKKLGLSRKDLRALEGDDEITAAMDTRREAVCGTAWRLEPGTGRNVKWLWAELEPHVVAIVSGALNSLAYGYTVQEIIYRQADGRVGIQSVEEKPFEWFSFSPDGRLLWRSIAGDLLDVETVYPGKFLLTRHLPTYRNPYGEALFARLYWPWFFRVNGWKFWATAMERTGTPFLKGTFPPGSSQLPDGSLKDNGELMAATLDSAVQNAVLALPEGWDAAFLTATQSGLSFEVFEQACLKRIQRLILGQTLTSDTGSDGGGSYALGQVHNEVRIDRRNADIRMVTRTVNTLIANLWQLNGFPNDPPDFIMEDGKGLEIPRAERDAKLVQAGIMTLTPDYLLRVYDFDDGDFTIPEKATPTNKASMGQAGNTPLNPVDQVRATDLSLLTFTPATGSDYPDQAALDAGIEALATADTQNQAMAESMLKPVLKLIKNATSYQEVIAGLAEQYPKMQTAELEDRLARALFAADAWGIINSRKA